MSQDSDGFEQLVGALAPWLGEVVVVGGWAHRLHRRHPWSGQPGYAAIRTRDADIVLPERPQLQGDIAAALARHGFSQQLSSDVTPPVAHYHLGTDDHGFYAEFLTPLRGSGTRRDGHADATVVTGGVVAQRLRHVELLLVEPWVINMGANGSESLPASVSVQIANPVTFMVQKLLIHDRRSSAKQAQDVLYIHDTIQLFAAALDRLHILWHEGVAPRLHTNQRAALRAAVPRVFDQTTDVIREAARIPTDRALTPDAVRYVCREGLLRVLGDAAHT